MPACPGCSSDFPLLDKLMCGRCQKYVDAPTKSDTVRASIAGEPQCEACGVTYLFLQTRICGGCRVKTVTDADTIRDFISERSTEHTKTASQHRINQQAQNSSLQKASDANMKMAALRKQNKSEKLDVLVTLWMYPITSAAPKKLPILPMASIFKWDDLADDMLDQLITKAQTKYATTPAIKLGAKGNAPPAFNRESVTFGIMQTATVVVDLDESNIVNFTTGRLYGFLKDRGHLSLKDMKGNSLTLRLYICELPPLIEEPDEIYSSGLEVISSMPRRSKRKLSIASSSQHAVTTKRVQPAIYESSYRPRASLAGLSDTVYEDFEFKRITVEMDMDGNSSIVKGTAFETIQVAKDWQKHRKMSIPVGGYLGKGFTKYAFQARLGTDPYALFQLKPIFATASDNKSDLMDELALLNLAKFFMDSFYRRARLKEIKKLPSMQWNVAGAFVGSLQVTPATAPEHLSQDDRTFIFPEFLAAPLLTINGLYKETKFSGNTSAGKNFGVAGRAVDAFAHHVVIDSGYTVVFADLQGIVGPDNSVCLFDPQAHTLERNCGTWDKGVIQINTFLADHKCNSVCRDMGFSSNRDSPAADSLGTNGGGAAKGSGSGAVRAPEVRTRPLRIGFV